MKKRKWYYYIFEDGMRVYCAGMDVTLLRAYERQHGKCIGKKIAA